MCNNRLNTNNFRIFQAFNGHFPTITFKNRGAVRVPPSAVEFVQNMHNISQANFFVVYRVTSADVELKKKLKFPSCIPFSPQQSPLLSHLSHLINKSFRWFEFPHGFKITGVIQIFKYSEKD